MLIEIRGGQRRICAVPPIFPLLPFEMPRPSQTSPGGVVNAYAG
jgi:hypothetical protein